MRNNSFQSNCEPLQFNSKSISHAHKAKPKNSKFTQFCENKRADSPTNDDTIDEILPKRATTHTHRTLCITKQRIDLSAAFHHHKQNSEADT